KSLIFPPCICVANGVAVRPISSTEFKPMDKSMEYGKSVRDESVDNYITMVIENFAIAMRTGIPILGMPVLDPFNITKLEIPFIDTPYIQLAANASHISVSGTSSFEPTYVHVDFDANEMYMNLHFLDIRIDGNYWCAGIAMVIFPIFGDGFFYINIMSIDSIGLGGIMITDDDHLQITELSLELAYDSLDIYFDNFLGGGSFGEEVNEAITVLANTIVQEILPLLNSAILPALKDYLNEALMQHTISEIISGGT
ncbi:hemolymph juvenile hormone binding, partial [Trinorchestia longiramus]